MCMEGGLYLTSLLLAASSVQCVLLTALCMLHIGSPEFIQLAWNFVSLINSSIFPLSSSPTIDTLLFLLWVLEPTCEVTGCFSFCVWLISLGVMSSPSHFPLNVPICGFYRSIALENVYNFHPWYFLQAWWDLLDHQGFLVLQDFQGNLVFLEDSTVPQENQGSQDHLACLEHQDLRAPLDQMVKYSSFIFISSYAEIHIYRFTQKVQFSKSLKTYIMFSKSSW